MSGINAISLKVKAMIIVSNEVFYESIQQNELVLIYSKLLGKLHQYIVSNSKQAFLVETGIPILMKGRCNEGCNDPRDSLGCR